MSEEKIVIMDTASGVAEFVAELHLDEKQEKALEKIVTDFAEGVEKRIYQIRVDRTPIVVDVDTLTGREILVLAEKDPNSVQLIQKMPGGGHKTIRLDEKVNFTELGVEKFLTAPSEMIKGRV